MTKLPINLNDLLRQRTVEGDRIEYKAGWNPELVILSFPGPDRSIQLEAGVLSAAATATGGLGSSSRNWR
jgi:hypothetical protein